MRKESGFTIVKQAIEAVLKRQQPPETNPQRI